MQFIGYLNIQNSVKYITPHRAQVLLTIFVCIHKFNCVVCTRFIINVEYSGVNLCS